MGGILSILVAEDDDDIRGMIKDSLMHESGDLELHIVEARDGHQAIAEASRQEFDCVITDLRMPWASGEDLIQSMRRHPLNANTPLLVVSGHVSDGFANRYSNIKMIPKPFEPAEVARAALKEIKLGRIDERVAVHLMNPFLDSIKNLLVNQVHLETEILPPMVKKSGEPMIGDFNCTMLITTGPSQTRFSIGFDRTMLDYLRTTYSAERTQQWANMASDAVAKQVCQGLFEMTLDRLVPLMGEGPRIAGISTVAARSQNDSTEFAKVSGIVVTAKTERGRILAGAYSTPSKRGR